jgi:hypothetical protein
MCKACSQTIAILGSRYIRKVSAVSSSFGIREHVAIFIPSLCLLGLFRGREMANRSHQSVLSLGLNPSPREIRLAYLRASLKAHPDHGGSNAEMVAVR